MTIAETKEWLKTQPPMTAKDILSPIDRLLLTEEGDDVRQYAPNLDGLDDDEKEIRQYAPNIEGLTDEDFR